MAKAEKSGIYVLNGARYQINAGDTLPDGAEMVGDEPVKPESRKKDAAPENRARVTDKKAE